MSFWLNAPYILLAFIFALFGQLGIFLWFSLALVLHEAGHMIAAKLLNIKIDTANFSPFCARIALKEAVDPIEELALASSGPFASLFTATLCAGLMYFFKNMRALEPLMAASLVLAFVNLLPALPLDGGRMVKSALSVWTGRGKAQKIASAISYAVAALLAGYAIYAFTEGVINVSAVAFSILILIGTYQDRREGVYSAARAAAIRNRRLRSKGSLRGKAAAVYSGSTVRQALKSSRGAPVITVLDEELRILGTLGEGDLMQAVLADRGDEYVEKLL